MVPLLVSILTWAATKSTAKAPQVKIETSKGTIVAELYPDKTPITVKNFLSYVEAKYYDGLIFHRVIDGFMIQGGGYTADFSRKSTRAPIRNEADNGLKNMRGTVSMARTRDPHSATAQFFINVKDNGFLDYKSPDARGWGYAVFGQVVEGMEVVDKIRTQPTSVQGGFRDVPVKTITITRAVVEAP